MTALLGRLACRLGLQAARRLCGRIRVLRCARCFAYLEG